MVMRFGRTFFLSIVLLSSFSFSSAHAGGVTDPQEVAVMLAREFGITAKPFIDPFSCNESYNLERYSLWTHCWSGDQATKKAQMRIYLSKKVADHERIINEVLRATFTPRNYSEHLLGTEHLSADGMPLEVFHYQISWGNSFSPYGSIALLIPPKGGVVMAFAFYNYGFSENPYPQPLQDAARDYFANGSVQAIK